MFPWALWAGSAFGDALGALPCCDGAMQRGFACQLPFLSSSPPSLTGMARRQVSLLLSQLISPSICRVASASLPAFSSLLPLSGDEREWGFCFKVKLTSFHLK